MEVTVADDATTTPVEGGACLHLATAAVDIVPPVVPAGWNCDAGYYGDGACDCGCGVFDELDCTDKTVDSCEWCNDTGSCSTGSCPGTIKPTDNAVCANCEVDTDCNPNQTCESNLCVAKACTTAADCDAGQVCQGGLCDNKPCTTATDCGMGQLCVADHCYTCAEITFGALTSTQADGTAALYSGESTPNQGGPAADSVRLEFYGSAADPAFNGETKGTFNLASGGDENYSTCSRCFRVVDDTSSLGRVFYQAAGSLTVDATSDQLNGTLKGSLTDLTLIEVKIAPSPSYASTPVAGGACLHVASSSFNITP